VRLAIQADASANNVAIFTKAVLPHAVAQDYNLIFPELIFVRGKRSAEHGLHAKNLEVRRRDSAISEFHRNIGVGKRDAAPRLRRHRREHAILVLPIEKIQRGDSVALAARWLFPDIQNLLSSGKRQGLQEHGIDKTEDRRGAPNPQCQSQNCGYGESRTVADHP
jgi:hypothetical protein